MSDLDIEAIELFINFLKLIGLPKSVGEIYGLLFVAPQPLFYITVEFIKLNGLLGRSLYYPNPWAIVWQILLIIVLYVPFYL